MVNLKFWEPGSREEFLLLEILPGKTKGLLLSVDKDKKINLSKSWRNFDLKKLAPSFKNLKKRQLVVAADPSLAASLELPVKIKRENNLADQPITPTEFDNLISQSIDKSFGHLRKVASSRFGTDEIDAILVGIKASHFKVDGHSVFNPMGFSGRSLNLALELTFTVRGIFELLKDYFSAREGFFFTSSTGSVVRTISGLNGPANFLVLRPEYSRVFLRDEGSGIREENLEWSFVDLLEAIASKVQIKEELGAENFLGGSFVFGDQGVLLAPILKHHLGRLVKELTRISKNKAVYVRLSEALPLSLPRIENRITLDYLPLRPTLDKFGFSLDFPEWRASEEDIFMSLAPFFEFYNDRGNSEINNRLRRKINWLAR